jgi:hypothetical protein
MFQPLKRIGVLGTESARPVTSAHIYDQWGPLLSPSPGSGRKTGLVMTHVWDKDRAEAEKFAARFGVPNVVDHYAEMVGRVDGVIQSGLKASFWSFQLVRPYLEAGVPVFMDRPGAYSLSGIRRLVGHAAQHNCPLMVTNNHEFNPVVDLLKARARLMGPLVAVIADALTDQAVRYFVWHCIHVWFMLFPVIEGRVRAVRTLLADPVSPSPMTVMECANPDGSQFFATLMRHRCLHRGWVKLFTVDSCYEAVIWPRESYRRKEVVDGPQSAEYLRTVFSVHPLAAFEKMIETRKMPQSHDQIVEKVRVFLAMHKSLLEDGATVEVNRLDENWVSPNMFPGYFPDGYFPAA